MNTSEVLLAGPADVTEVHECGAKNEGYDDARFSLVVYVGTPFALCGILFNSILIVSSVFSVGKSRREFKIKCLTIKRRYLGFEGFCEDIHLNKETNLSSVDGPFLS